MLNEVNRLLEENNEAAMFVTVFFAIFDAATGEIVFANAGHNPPLVVHPDGSSSLLEEEASIALGVMPGFTYERHVATLAPGDTLVLYTDGVTEAENAQQEQFGLDRMRALFANTPSGDARAITEALFAAVKDFAGEAPQFDDITALTLCRATTKAGAGDGQAPEEENA